MSEAKGLETREWLQPYSAITDDPRFFEARVHSPQQRNWMWTPPLKKSTLIVRDPQVAAQHRTLSSGTMFERVVADDSVLHPLEGGETRRDWIERAEMHSPHPIKAANGPELMREFGFTEEHQGTVLWS